MFSRPSSSSSSNFLADKVDHLWATAATPAPVGRMASGSASNQLSVSTALSNGAGTYSNYSNLMGNGANGGVASSRTNRDGGHCLPGKLDQTLMREPRVVQGMPQVRRGGNGVRRKMVPSMLNPDGKGQQPQAVGGSQHGD